MPAAPMPVSAQVRSLVRDHHQMEGPRRYQRFASGAQVCLAGRVRLDGGHRDLEVTPTLHPSPSEQAPGDEAERDCHRHHHQNDIEDAVRFFPERVEAHGVTLHSRRPMPVTVPSMSWISHEDRGPVRWLTLSNPGRRNAVPADGWSELGGALAEFEQSPARVLVIRGDGEDFCAGADLDPGGADETGLVARHRRMKVVAAAATSLHRLAKPTVAAVDGVAVGAGLNLALGCDVVIATTRARFSEIFVRRGLTVDFGGTWLLPRIVGLQRAKEMALSGRIVAADEAHRIGLCLDLVEPQDLEQAAQRLAESFLAGAPVAQMFAKQGIDAAWEVSFQEALGWEGQSQSICFGTDDFEEGVSAFLEKRPPDFRGR